ncbi:unnamed protein product, partial [Nesidiocoris tenuis]
MPGCSRIRISFELINELLSSLEASPRRLDGLYPNSVWEMTHASFSTADLLVPRPAIFKRTSKNHTYGWDPTASTPHHPGARADSNPREYRRSSSSNAQYSLTR